ncbi:type VI secretion system-associated protein TagF [Azoarcus olearius]|uniref:Type VI secretion system-associated protein TagF n=1 Tax=Azoarcus sp. (strain BH72) TaxID=418699 RepID=A1KCE9_AZOSB|nr:type VI secretion system-associated protein TagF [Azoarcus olearius]CAL96505.1 conserved hypothetical protein [Azoarcus olearius]
MLPGESAPGWYGKLPALGDFASRRLPQGFVAAWDGWLQRGLAYSQEHLGAAWLDSFLTAPVWRFVLGERTLDTGAWAGIVLPSVDRVGRYFPLTLCAPLPAFSPTAATLGALTRWTAALEDVARAGLDPLATVDSFDASLAGCPAPLLPATPPSALGDALLRGDAFVRLSGGDGAGLPVVAGDAASHLGAALFAPYTLWWCSGDAGAADGFACHGMPSAAVFARMLQYAPGQA